VRRLHGPHHKSPHHHHHGNSKYTVLVYKYLSRDRIDTEPLATAQRVGKRFCRSSDGELSALKVLRSPQNNNFANIYTRRNSRA
jgi:hypothetical protein